MRVGEVLGDALAQDRRSVAVLASGSAARLPAASAAAAKAASPTARWRGAEAAVVTRGELRGVRGAGEVGLVVVVQRVWRDVGQWVVGVHQRLCGGVDLRYRNAHGRRGIVAENIGIAARVAVGLPGIRVVDGDAIGWLGLICRGQVAKALRRGGHDDLRGGGVGVARLLHAEEEELLGVGLDPAGDVGRAGEAGDQRVAVRLRFHDRSSRKRTGSCIERAVRAGVGEGAMPCVGVLTAESAEASAKPSASAKAAASAASATTAEAAAAPTAPTKATATGATSAGAASAGATGAGGEGSGLHDSAERAGDVSIVKSVALHVLNAVLQVVLAEGGEAVDLALHLKVARPLIWPCTPVTAMDSFADADESSPATAPSDGSCVSVLSSLVLASVRSDSSLLWTASACVPRPTLATVPEVAPPAAGAARPAPGAVAVLPAAAVAVCVGSGATREARSTLNSAVCVGRPPFWLEAFTTTSWVTEANPVRSVLTT